MADFDELDARVLQACHKLLDHSFAIGQETWAENQDALAKLGDQLVESRVAMQGDRGQRQEGVSEPLAGARTNFRVVSKSACSLSARPPNALPSGFMT